MRGFRERLKVVPLTAKVALYLLPFLDDHLQAMGRLVIALNRSWIKSSNFHGLFSLFEVSGASWEDK
jgi:hypothetical protein